MPAKPLTVTVPEPLLKQLRGRARRAKRTVEAEVIQLLSDAIAAGDRAPSNGAVAKRVKKSPPTAAKKPWTNLADWAEKHDEHWGSEINSEDVESFTGRRY